MIDFKEKSMLIYQHRIKLYGNKIKTNKKTILAIFRD